ncbi:hypothetical protein FDECE_9126 [Fusarium decemcellulare]|nr:hypothetical protein FDECE_9126 [Fusarium decemcellulare]
MKRLKASLAAILAACYNLVLISALDCVALLDEGPVQITADCVDTLYDDPIIVSESDEDAPMVHHRVSGYFKNASIEFNFYFPPKSTWEGRFYQRLYPTQEAVASNDTVAFGINSGAYTIQTTGSSGYRASAAAAKFSKSVAARYYNHVAKIHGFIYGGSGGSYQTVGAMENTEGIWDGAVTIVQAVPVSIPNVPAVRAFAGLVLRNKSSEIIDAVRPGGSGDPLASLNEVEQAIFREATLMGIPVRKWEDFDMVADTRTLDVLTSTVHSLDPDYCHDFWNEPGYLGWEDSDLGDIMRAAVVDVNTTITTVQRNDDGTAKTLRFQSFPVSKDSRGFVISVYSSNGTLLSEPLTGSLNQTLQAFVLAEGNDPTTLGAISEGGKVRVDNRCFIALLPYYRYRLSSRPGFYGFDQFRDSDGEPIYPQRSVEVAALVSEATSGGGTHTGHFAGKMIVVDNLWDSDAFSWHADWYRGMVQNVTGNEFEHKYRIWYNDHADHNEDVPEDVRASYLIDYNGISEQALRDLSQWVEQEITPPLSTRYRVSDSQILVADQAEERRGIQPTVQLTANGKGSQTPTEVTKNQQVNFKAQVEAAPGAGEIVSVEWDYLGIGNYTAVGFGDPSKRLVVDAQYAYPETGTYFAGVRVGSHRDGNSTSLFAKVMNIDRVRINVK